MASIVERAIIQLDQLCPSEESPQNRSSTYSMPQAQKMILERLFSSLYPEVWKDIQKSEEWEQLENDSPLHREQFQMLAQRFAERVEHDVVAEQYRPLRAPFYE